MYVNTISTNLNIYRKEDTDGMFVKWFDTKRGCRVCGKWNSKSGSHAMIQGMTYGPPYPHALMAHSFLCKPSCKSKHIYPEAFTLDESTLLLGHMQNTHRHKHTHVDTDADTNTHTQTQMHTHNPILHRTQPCCWLLVCVQVERYSYPMLKLPGQICCGQHDRSHMKDCFFMLNMHEWVRWIVSRWLTPSHDQIFICTSSVSRQAKH